MSVDADQHHVVEGETMTTETSIDQGAACWNTRRLPLVEEVAEVRHKNQVTIPKLVADALGLRPGDRLVFVVNEDARDAVHLYLMPKSFAGIAADDAYGGPEGGVAYVRAERQAWGE